MSYVPGKRADLVADTVTQIAGKYSLSSARNVTPTACITTPRHGFVGSCSGGSGFNDKG